MNPDNGFCPFGMLDIIKNEIIFHPCLDFNSCTYYSKKGGRERDTWWWYLLSYSVWQNGREDSGNNKKLHMSLRMIKNGYCSLFSSVPLVLLIHDDHLSPFHKKLWIPRESVSRIIFRHINCHKDTESLSAHIYNRGWMCRSDGYSEREMIANKKLETGWKRGAANVTSETQSLESV